MSERYTLKVLGTEIGTYESWDQCDTDVFDFYLFEPNEAGTKLGIPKSAWVVVDLNNGIAWGNNTDEETGTLFLVPNLIPPSCF